MSFHILASCTHAALYPHWVSMMRCVIVYWFIAYCCLFVSEKFNYVLDNNTIMTKFSLSATTHYFASSISLLNLTAYTTKYVSKLILLSLLPRCTWPRSNYRWVLSKLYPLIFIWRVYSIYIVMSNRWITCIGRSSDFLTDVFWWCGNRAQYIKMCISCCYK